MVRLGTHSKERRVAEVVPAHGQCERQVVGVPVSEEHVLQHNNVCHHFMC